MNYCVQSSRHERSAYQRVRIEVVHVVPWFATHFQSQVLVDFLKMWDRGGRSWNCMAILSRRWCLNLQPQVSPHSVKRSKSWFVSVAAGLRACVRFYIRLPHLRNRCCVILIWTFFLLLTFVRFWPSGSSPAHRLGFWGAPRGDHLSTLLAFWPKSQPSTGPSASRRHFLSAHDHGLLPSSLVAAALYCPYVGLTVHWAVSVRRPDCTLSRLRA